MNDINVLVSEVGPCDGLRNTKQYMPTDYEIRWISAAAAAGIPGEARYGYLTLAGVTKEPLIKSSRSKPGSRNMLILLDPGVRRGDEYGHVQSLPKGFVPAAVRR